MTDAQRLIAEAATAAEQSYSPYSHYRVGAVVVTSDGVEYRGCNVENAAYGASICAEANAITNGWAEHFCVGTLSHLCHVYIPFIY